MFHKFFLLCASLAVARAGYIPSPPAFAHAAPIAYHAQPPLTYTIPGHIKAQPLPPVVTTSYGYSSAHTPVPAPIIRAEPIHHAPVAFAAPAIHPIPAPAPLAFAAPAIHAAPAPLPFVAPAVHPAPALGFAGNFGGLGHSYAAGFGFGPSAAVHPIPAPAPLAFAAPAIHAAPAPLPFVGPSVHPAPALGFAGNLGGFGASYAAGFGFGAAPGPIGFAGGLAPAAFGHSKYGNHF
ncbi:hypothetical protein FQR65_LT00515 [Abscondita terminalis]|nr:hypothetical protein FQR65_LT00515 [Abscondita terminalis]